jgi:hypothetical protein
MAPSWKFDRFFCIGAAEDKCWNPGYVCVFILLEIITVERPLLPLGGEALEKIHDTADATILRNFVVNECSRFIQWAIGVASARIRVSIRGFQVTLLRLLRCMG